MKKSEVSEILLHLWNSLEDQAPYDYTIKKAFENCPVNIQKKFIKEMLDENTFDKEMLNIKIYEKAKKLVQD